MPQSKKHSDAMEHTPLHRIPGLKGDPLQLGADTYHFAVHTTLGTQEIREFIAKEGFPIGVVNDGDSIGKILVTGAQAMNNFVLIAGLLQRIVYESVDGATLTQTSSPKQLMIAIDGFFEFSGLDWLQNILKNSIAAAANQMNRKFQDELQKAADRAAVDLDKLDLLEERTKQIEQETTGTDEPPAPLTPSSSRSKARQPTPPEPMPSTA